MAAENLVIELTREESLVLFDWLARQDSSQSLTFDDPAEQVVLWKLQGRLETSLVEILQPNYGQVLSNARQKIRQSS